MTENNLLPTLVFSIFLTFGVLFILIMTYISEISQQNKEYIEYEQDLMIFLEHVNSSIVEGKSIYDVFKNYKTNNKELSKYIEDALEEYNAHTFVDAFDSYENRFQPADFTLMKCLLFFDGKENIQKQLSSYIKNSKDYVQDLKKN